MLTIWLGGKKSTQQNPLNHCWSTIAFCSQINSKAILKQNSNKGFLSQQKNDYQKPCKKFSA